MSVIKRLVTQHDKQRQKKQQIDLEVVEAEEETQIVPDEAPSCEEESENELDNYKELYGMYMN